MTQWHPGRPGNFFLDQDDEAVASVSFIERDGQYGWLWNTYVNGDEGFCETLEQAKAEAEQSAQLQRVN